MVGTTGFEPATSCSQSRRATKLRQRPNKKRARYTWLGLFYGAGDGNRTRVMSLEGSGSTIELHPRECVCIRYYNFAHGARAFCWMNFSRPLARQCYASYSMQHIVYDERRYMVDAQMKRGFLEVKRASCLRCVARSRTDTRLSRTSPTFSV